MKKKQKTLKKILKFPKKNNKKIGKKTKQIEKFPK